jgi:hypothetical protein
LDTPKKLGWCAHHLVHFEKKSIPNYFPVREFFLDHEIQDKVPALKNNESKSGNGVYAQRGAFFSLGTISFEAYAHPKVVFESSHKHIFGSRPICLTCDTSCNPKKMSKN